MAASQSDIWALTMTTLEIFADFAETVEARRPVPRQRLSAREVQRWRAGVISRRFSQGLDSLEDRWRRARAPKWNPGKAPKVAFRVPAKPRG